MLQLKKKKKIKCYDVSMDSDVIAISLVDDPAIESNFIALSKETPKVIYLEKEDKHLIIGAVLIPDKPIYRNQDGEEFYIQFSKETIEKLAHDYLIHDRNSSVTEQHDRIVEDVYLVETWLKTSEMDKSNEYMDVPVGTWIAAMKVENEDIWSKVKNGELKGFSIESFVNLNEIMLNKIENKDMAKEVNMEAIQVDDNFWDKLREIISKAMGKPQESNEVEKTVGEIVDEMEVEGGSKDEKPKVVEQADQAEEVVPAIDEQVKEIVEDINENADSEEEAKEDLQAVVDGLREEIAKKDAEIEQLKKTNAKLSKQPSVKPAKAELGKQGTNMEQALAWARGEYKIASK
nr:MAG: Putative serine protease XkdF [Bacteriophage sp.]